VRDAADHWLRAQHLQNGIHRLAYVQDHGQAKFSRQGNLFLVNPTLVQRVDNGYREIQTNLANGNQMRIIVALRQQRAQSCKRIGSQGVETGIHASLGRLAKMKDNAAV